MLFYLPVHKAWLRQLVLGLVLIGHSAARGVVELLRDLFDYPISLGTVFNIVHAARNAPARQCNHAQDLRHVRVGGHDEIFQGQQPVLVGVDLLSSYCYLLSCEKNIRDADTWGAFAGGARAGALTPTTSWPTAATPSAPPAQAEVPCPTRPVAVDVFHAVAEVQKVVAWRWKTGPTRR